MHDRKMADQEWRNPDNWSRRGLFGLYFSKRDPRLFVPKAAPSAGWTLNLARPAAVWILKALITLPVLLAVGLCLHRSF